jgi:hypothetical protein
MDLVEQARAPARSPPARPAAENAVRSFVTAARFAAQLLDRFPGLVLETRLAAVEMVEAARQLTRKLDVRHLILAHRHLVGAVDQDVGRLQQRIAEKTVGRQILVLQLFLLILVGRHALQPAERRHHRQQQMQFGMLGHLRLDEQRRPAGSTPAASQSMTMSQVRIDDALRVVVLGGQACQSATKNRQGYSCCSRPSS